MKSFIDLLSQKQVWRRIAFLILLGIAVHLILPQITELEQSWQVLAKMSLWLVGLALIAQALSYLGSGYLLRMTLAIVNQTVTLLRSTLIVLGSTSVGMVAGGMVGSSAAIYRWTREEGGNMEGATLASLLPALFNNLMLALVSIFGLLHLILVHNLTQAQLIGFCVALFVLVLLIGLFAVAVRYRDRTMTTIVGIGGTLSRVQRKTYDSSHTRKEVDDIFKAWDSLWRGEWHFLALGAFLNVAFDMLTLYFLFIAAGVKIGPGVLLSGYGLPQLLGRMAFIIPGGVGVVESSMAALYAGLGIPDATTVVVVLGYRLISFWVPSLSGFPIAAYLERSQKRNHRKELSHDPVGDSL